MQSLTKLGLAAILLLLTLPVSAQTARPGGSNANAQLMQQMQQLASERTQLQAENAKMKQELDELKKKMKGLESENDSLTRRAQSSEGAASRAAAGSESLNQSLAQQRTRMEELVGKFRETAGTLRDVETERNKLQTDLAASQQQFKICVDKNLAMYQVTSEILDRYQDQGFWSSLTKSEPFTRLKRTQIENLVDEYRGRASDQLVDQSTQPPGT
ncbi:MAG TPA: hypothetical protein VEZ88_03470 [Steroidobacteraceae bacterium]|nr:hypothetical protein [Steroidobacteraceae bacterium]